VDNADWTGGPPPVENAPMPAPSYSHGASDVPLLGETIGANLERTVGRFGDRDAVVSCHQDVRLTYDEFDAAVNRIASGLLAAGMVKGDRIGIWAPNCVEWVLVQFSTAKIGAVLVNINPAYRTHEVEYALRQSGVRMLVSARAFKTSDYMAMIDEVRDGLPALQEVVYLDGDEWDSLAATTVDEGALRERMASLAFDDPINIQYTSGTTGFPKGATLSHHNILNNGYFVAELCSYTEADRVCLPVPFYHCFGMVMGNLGAVTHGSCIVIPAPGFEPGATLEAVASERCTSLYGVPTMFIAELDHPEFDSFDLSSLRTGIMAGSPCPVEVMKRVQRDMHMSEVGICYGMTETSPVSTQTRSDDSLERRVSTVGRPGPHIEVKIVDPDTGLVVECGTPGEFCTRGYSVMLGYWDEPDKTAEAIDAARWMHTGDLATMDEDGYCNIVGRIKDMVIRGGENVYPREIEEYLYTHPDIADVQVVGVPDARYGEELCAWVVPRAGASLSEEDVREFCQARLAHYKVPRYVVFTDGFPMTVTGKVQKYKMREDAIARLGLEEAAAVKSA
jgi:fatty-acyl-CoA synthase